MLLGWETVNNAARRLLRMHLLDEVEDADATMALPEGKTVDDIVDEVMKGSPEKVHFVMGKWIGAIDHAWGNDVGLVLHHMGLERQEEKDEVLYVLIMSCWGHGVGIGDDYSKAFAEASEKLKPHGWTKLEESPCEFCQHSDLTFLDEYLETAPKYLEGDWCLAMKPIEGGTGKLHQVVELKEFDRKTGRWRCTFERRGQEDGETWLDVSDLEPTEQTATGEY